MFFISTNFLIHSYLVHKRKNRKTIILSQRLKSFSYALLFALMQQITVTFISYSNRNYNVMTSEIIRKFRKTFVLVYMSLLEHFPKFNKQVVSNKNVLGGQFSKK